MANQDSPGAAPASWLKDPTGRHQYRYWDATAWTDYVADDGQQAIDPLEAEPDPLGELRRREAEVESELAEAEEEIARAARSSNDADLANILIADIEARMQGDKSAANQSPLHRSRELQKELESIRRQLGEISRVARLH